MKNRLLFILTLLFTLVVQETEAQPVTQEDAKQIAAQFLKRQYARQSTRRKAPSQSELTTDVVFNATDTEGQPYLYAVSTTRQDGYVLVSGDERFATVLGYGDKHGFDEERMPENMREFLQDYIDEMKHLQSIDYQPKAGVKRANAVAKTDVSPLMTTQWNQRAPYNDLCPMDNGNRSATGCVATSMAQVVNYYIQKDNKPTALIADIPGYTTSSRKIEVPTIVASTAPFPAKDLLKDTYNTGDNRTDDEKNAVAELMYYCGASIRMNYTSSGSGAYSCHVPSALIKYFGFAETARLEILSNYAYADWVDLIYGELKAGRPVMLSGAKPSGGHSFVTDGFNADNTLFHINWGWGGSSNDYFALSVLNPDDAGQAGAATGTGGYIMDQQAVIGIQLEGATPEPRNPLALNMGDFYVNGTDIHFATFNNNTDEADRFDIGLGCYDGGTITLFKTLYSNIELHSGSYFSDLSINAICPDFANQTRKLIPVSRIHGTSTWIAGTNPDINYFTAVYDAHGVPTLTVHPVPDIQNTTFSVPKYVYVNSPTKIKATFTNNGEEYYNYIFFFVSTDANNKGNYASVSAVVAPTGIPTSVDFDWTPTTEATYHIWAATDLTGTNIIGTTTVTAANDASLEGRKMVLLNCTFTGQDDQSLQIDNNGVRSIDVYNNWVSSVFEFKNLTDEDINGALAIRLDKYDPETSQFIDDANTVVTNGFYLAAGRSMKASFGRNTYKPGYTYRIRILMDGVCMDDRYRINLKGVPETITIASAENWMNFCNDVASGNTYSDKIVKMTANITTSTWMSGTFSGIFDGNGHTLNVTVPEDNTDYLAPFRTIRGATIKNLTLSGSVATGGKYAAGLVGEVTGKNNHIENCVVNTNVLLNGYGGGVVGQLTGSLTVKDVIYGGTITQNYSSDNAGGFIGDYDGVKENLSMTNCMFNGTYVGNGFHPIGIKHVDKDFNDLSCTNCFYTTTPPMNVSEGDFISAEVIKASQLTLGTGISILKGNTCSFRNEVFYYGTVTLGYNDPEAVVTYSLNGEQLSGNSFSIREENAAFNDGSATITADNDYRISYNLNGGTVETPNPTSYTSANEDIILNTPTRDGWDFDGWTGTGLDGAQMSVTIPKGSIGHRHYTATWTADELDTDASGAYLINNKYDWERFCARMRIVDEYDRGNYDGKVVKLTADIGTAEDPVTTKVGCMTDRILSFNGTFDGQGHTLYVNYTDDAPFMYTSYATIQNLHVAGNIIAGNRYASGLVSQAYNNLTIRNCHSSVNISGRSTDYGFLSGFVGIHRKSGEETGDITITGSLFDGSITTTNGTIRCAGFVGWTKYPSHVTISNSLLAPTSISNGILANTFVTYDTAGGTPDISNTYFIPVTNLTANQGKEAQTITAGENVISLAISGAPTEYDLGGITAYEGNPGLKYNSLLYAGSQDVVNLTLASAEPEEGRYFYQYATSGGSLFTNSPTNATLIMPDGTTAISAIIDKKIPTIFLADTEDNTSLLSTNDGVTRNVILPGRTLQTGSYNTFAVPFDIPASQYSAYNIIGVKKLTGSSFDSSTGVLSLTFADETKKIEAGHPYLVKVSANTMSPTFDEVLIYAEAKPVTTTAVNFVPTFGKTEVTGDEKSILFLGANNTLYNPDSLPSYMRGMRAYFQLKGNVALAHEFRMELDDDADGIQDIQDSKFKIQNVEGIWYTLDGRKLSGKPTVSGIYLNNGKKVIIK
ncbi:MAG: C10 family peptidase [Bacteroidaceae bacterium]|nr:C10 family peptidase [Bacteroidaceae bacterium]